ncbi:12151_t:CDS:2, partial [Funneliformis geosporum]
AEDISAERTRAIKINAFTERYIEDLLVKQIIPLCVVSDSAEENQNINTVVSTQSDSEEEIDNDNISNSETDPIELVNQWNIIVGDWLNLLDNEEFESEEEIGMINHPATNQDAKWSLLQIFSEGLEFPTFYDLLINES